MVMRTAKLNVVTGAFSYTGKYITRRLLSMGESVKTLTGRPNSESPFGCQVSASPFNFDNPKQLTESLEGATTLYNTYWVRFSHGQVTFDRAIENTNMLIKAAEAAGIRRIIHISITKIQTLPRNPPSPNSEGRRWSRRLSSIQSCPTPSSGQPLSLERRASLTHEIVLGDFLFALAQII